MPTLPSGKERTIHCCTHWKNPILFNKFRECTGRIQEYIIEMWHMKQKKATYCNQYHDFHDNKSKVRHCGSGWNSWEYLWLFDWVCAKVHGILNYHFHGCIFLLRWYLVMNLSSLNYHLILARHDSLLHEEDFQISARTYIREMHTKRENQIWPPKYLSNGYTIIMVLKCVLNARLYLHRLGIDIYYARSQERCILW